MGNCFSSDTDYSPFGGSGSKSGHPEAVILSQADIAALPKEGYNDRDHGRVSWKTLISSDKTPSNSLTAGIGTLPPKRAEQPISSGGNLAPHRHSHAEVYIVLRGEGIVNVDMVEHKVEAGSIVFIPGNAEHGVRNSSLTEEFVWYYCFAADKFSDIRYRFKNDMGVPVRR